MRRDLFTPATWAALALAATFSLGSVRAATFGDLSAGQAPPANPYPAAPYASPPNGGVGPTHGAPIYSGPQGAPPAPLDAAGAALMPPSTPPEAYLPFGQTGELPHGRLQVWSFGQVNSGTDPFDTKGLSTPFMFVPWSTPLSAWTNAQTWNWWRERAGVQPPYW